MAEQLTEEQISQMSPEQIAALQKQNCIFCHIISGKVPSKKIYEDEHCIAILDINPATKGHILLLPKEHYMILPQVPEETIRHLAKITKLLSKSLIRGLAAEGTNIFIANGAVAGQRAPHMIIHVIPRNESDGITCFELPQKEIRPEDLSNLQKLIGQQFGINVSEVPPRASEEEKKEVEVKHQPKKKLEEIDLNQLKKMIE